MPRRLFPCLLLLFALANAAVAAPPPADFKVDITPAAARPGETVAVTVTAAINAPYLVYSVTPVPPPGPERTTLTVEAGPLKAVGETTESVPKRKQDFNFGEKGKEVAYHEGTATFTQRLKVPEDAAPGATVPVKATLRYQACTDKFCLPPKDQVLETKLAVEAGPARAEYTGTAAPVAATAANSGAAADGSLVPFLLAAFGAGLLALVTPCVFPMIPVTLAFFTKQATPKEGAAPAQGAIVRLAATYSLGIILAFTAIGAVLAATVGAAGANQVAANPWVNLAFAVLFVVFGLALLEVFELRLPAGLQNLTTAGRGHGGTLGVLLMGLAFVIAAFTCTAPFIGTVLVAAAQASTGAQWFRPILGMAVFATALALPFFLLALFPGWLARLPKSGAWLSTVKGALGFVELAAALKFLSNADLVWQWRLLPQPVLLALWAIIALAGAFWLMGLLRIGFGTPEGRPTRARAAWAAAFSAIAIYCLWGLTGRPLNDWMVAFLPPADYGVGVNAAEAHDGLTWHETLEAGLAQAKAENKPLFIDFTGYTCTNCRLMEKNVFPNPNVRAELEQFVRVRLYTDGGKDGPKNQAYQEQTFGDVALPLYGVLGLDGAVIGRSAGISKASEFANFLRTSRERELQARGGAVTASTSTAD